MARDRQRVLMVAAEYPPHVGGVASYTQAVVAGLRETGAQVRVVTSVPDRAGTRLPGVTVTRTPALLNRRLVKTLALLAAGVNATGRVPTRSSSPAVSWGTFDAK